MSKNINAMFLAIILVTGTITLFSPSFMKPVNAQTEPYYYYGERENGYSSYEPQSIYPSKYADREYNSYKPSYEKNIYDTAPSYGNGNYQPREYSSYQQDYKQEYQSYEKDNNYKSKKDDSSKSVSISKINCINNNVNINGNNVGDINIGSKGVTAAAEGYLGAYSSGNGYYGKGYNGGDDNKKDKGIDCIINNNNTNTNIGDGNQTPEQRATLDVTKLVTCQEADDSALVPSIQQISADCDQLLFVITEDQFNITVTDTNVNPSEFVGSETGQSVTLDAGPFTVTETPDDSVAADVAILDDIQIDVTGPFPSFTGDCTQTGAASFSSTGDIVAGGQETCNIVNNFVIEEEEEEELTASTTDSPITAQGTTDSSELTALEKITKLKQQWLDLLP
jgi:hypothetical protein